MAEDHWNIFSVRLRVPRSNVQKMDDFVNSNGPGHVIFLKIFLITWPGKCDQLMKWHYRFETSRKSERNWLYLGIPTVLLILSVTWWISTNHVVVRKNTKSNLIFGQKWPLVHRIFYSRGEISSPEIKKEILAVKKFWSKMTTSVAL